MGSVALVELGPPGMLSCRRSQFVVVPPTQNYFFERRHFESMVFNASALEHRVELCK